MSARLADLVYAVRDAGSPEEASLRFRDRAAALGASYLQTRLYRRPHGVLTAEKHLSAAGVVVRSAPARWSEGHAAFDFVCLERNPLLTPIREGRTLYAFSEFAPRQDRAWGPWWEALSEARIGEAVCATAYGRGRAIASFHLGFERADAAQEARDDLQLAGLVLAETLLRFAEDGPPRPRLTAREQDVLSWVAEGKSDWEVAAILGVSEATVRFHLDNARGKLGAVNRVQAAARFAAAGGL